MCCFEHFKNPTLLTIIERSIWMNCHGMKLNINVRFFPKFIDLDTLIFSIKYWPIRSSNRLVKTKISRYTYEINQNSTIFTDFPKSLGPICQKPHNLSQISFTTTWSEPFSILSSSRIKLRHTAQCYKKSSLRISIFIKNGGTSFWNTNCGGMSQNLKFMK